MQRVAAFAVALLVAVPRAGSASGDAAELDFALRRAAYEIATGRFEATAGALDHAASVVDDARRRDLALLLATQGEILAGRSAEALPALEQLLASRDAWVRAQAAAHVLGLALAGLADSTATAVEARDALAAWQANRDGLGRDGRDAMALGELLAGGIEHRLGDATAARKAFERARRGPAAPAAHLVLGEAALAAGDAAAAARHFTALERTRPDPWGGWTADWAKFGRARGLVAAGRASEAMTLLGTLGATEHLAAYARLLRAQLAFESQDLETAARELAGLDLGRWSASLAAEARLLEMQVAIDRGAFAPAESLGEALEMDLERWFARDRDGAVFERVLRLDLRVWHTACARATLSKLAARRLLHQVPDPSALPDLPAALLLQEGGDVGTWRVTLCELYVHAPELPETRAARDAWRTLARERSQLLVAESQLEATRRRLAERLALLARGRAGADSCRVALAGLEQGVAAQVAGLAAHDARLEALEKEWRADLAARLSAFERALAVLRRGETRLEARYRRDRGVRANPETARARAVASGESQWMGAAEALRRDLAAGFEARLHEVASRYERSVDRERLAALGVWLEKLDRRLQELEAALATADAAERAACAAAEREYAVLAARVEMAATHAAAVEEAARTARARLERARRLAYAEAGRSGMATAAFLDAIERPAGDPERLPKLQHAAARLQSFLDAHLDSPRAAEMLYRLGEVSLQRASLQYQTELAAFLESGGEASRAPLPVEDYAAALASYRLLLQRFPAAPRARDSEYQLGFLLAEMGAPEISCEHLERFLAGADSGDVRVGRAALRLGDNALVLGDRVRALDAFERAARSNSEEERDLGRFKAGWCAYDLDQHERARTHLARLLAEPGTRGRELQPEALELLALAFSADHAPRGAADVLDSWGRPDYDFAILRRMAQLFASRAQYDEAIEAHELLLERNPSHPELPAVAEGLLGWIEVRRGVGAAHARAATLAPLFAPHASWARETRRDTGPGVRARWQSRLVEEDVRAAREDSLADALARPETAAARMAQRLRAAAVHEHRVARQDSLHAPQHLDRAASLYAQTLQLFPGAEGEAQTWVYLGEAHFDRGQHAAAADAYAAASRHPQADSVLAHTAASQELAALDAACAARPDSLLDRYARRAAAFADRWHDPRGVAALERAGSMAFGSGRDAVAEASYSDVARRTADPLQAARALRMTGDLSWKRDDYDAAAARYDSALARARSGRSDSLTSVLSRLVAAAAYRGAEVRDAGGEPQDAAARFEAVAARHPDFEFADRALYRAAGLRAAAGDTSAAAVDYTRLVQRYPNTELHADAWLELGRCQESDPLLAARTYRGFADRYPQHAQTQAARLRAGGLFERGGRPAAADSEYARVLAVVHPAKQSPKDPELAGDLWMRRARATGSPLAAAPHYARALECGTALSTSERAEAHFQIAESGRPAYAALTLQVPLQKSLRRKQAALEKLAGDYAKSAEFGVEPWHAAACLRLGEALQDLGTALRNSPAPAELEGDDLYAYQETLVAQTTALEDRAVDSWSRGLAAARKAGHEDTWTSELRARLYPRLATRLGWRPQPLFVLVQP